jgi:5-methylcytosine-specific restriction endonuclease McrA
VLKLDNDGIDPLTPPGMVHIVRAGYPLRSISWYNICMPHKDHDVRLAYLRARRKKRKESGITRAEESYLYRMEHPEYVERQRTNRRKVYYQRKQKAVALLGGKCCRCGCDDIRCLEIDHIIPIRGDRSMYGDKLFRSIVNGGSTDNLQVLCANCHAIKTYEDGNGA